MFDAVTSPPKSESELTELEAIDRAFAPTSVFAETEMGPVVSTEPSLGYANPDVKPTAFGGADTEVEVAPGTILTPYALAVAPACEPGDDAPAEPASSKTDASAKASGSRIATTHYGPACERRNRSALFEPATGEFDEAFARSLVRPQRRIVGDVPGNLFGDRPDFLDDARLVLGVVEQLVDPRFGAVVGLDVVLQQQLAEDETDPDVREGPEREQPLRRVDERVDLGMICLDLRDNRADRLVDERDPDFLRPSHS